ncbi:MAG TPA: HAD-IIIC family phosphatase [Flavisolibacter sp.]|nr:HAD-IIIC family phosphatase [Flavisolibacter sp.]
MLEFTRLKNNLKKNTEGFTTIRLALLCDSSSQHLNLALKGYGIDRQLSLQIYEAEYDQIEQQVFDTDSELYSTNQEAVIISKSSHKLLDEFYVTSLEDRNSFAERKFAHLKNMFFVLQNATKATLIHTNFQELNDQVFGSFASNVSHSFLYQVRKLNLLLMEEAQARQGFFICDVQSLTTEHGLQHVLDQKHLVKADLIWSLEFLPLLAKNMVGLIEACKGRLKKCLVLDLDNTLWGGVIGDDGLEGIQLGDFGIGKAFTRFQKWIKQLKQRGIIICICSKNNEAIAKEVFEKHPDSILKLEDIAVFAANWNNKVDNLHFIKNTLNIGFDAMVFVDDNPFERNMVKEAIPELDVPEMPEDPVDYLPFLQALNLFETVSYTEEDSLRTQLYRQEAERVSYQQVYKNENDFLDSLQMTAAVSTLNSFSLPRAAQLSQRSNQFNLRTVRYTETELEAIAASLNYSALVVSLQDRFGDYGLISFIVLKKISSAELFIESWMMSCRVLKRGVEHFVLNQIVAVAKKLNCQTIVGEYIPTPKNELVKDHYAKLGFRLNGNYWLLDVASFADKKTFVQLAAAKNTNEVISA